MLTALILTFSLTGSVHALQEAEPVLQEGEAIIEQAQPGPVLQLGAAPQTSPAAQAAPDMLLPEAGRYAAFHQVVSDLSDAPIESADDLDQAMDRLSAFYSEDRLVRAWIAYAAIIAAQHPEYIDEVRELADYYGPQAAMSGLMYDPSFATSFVYAQEAEDSVAGALDRDNAHLVDVSERFRDAAYDLQSTRWARVRAGDRQDRLAALREAGSRDLEVDTRLISTLRRNAAAPLAASALFEDEAAPGAQPVLSLTVGEGAMEADERRMGRILSVAALQSLSPDAGEPNAAIESLLTDPSVERCLAWVRLDMEQCIAAGHFKYEDSFCIAEHALLDVSRCLGASGN